MPVSQTRVELSEEAGETRLTSTTRTTRTTRYDNLEALSQVLAMGLEYGLR